MKINSPISPSIKGNFLSTVSDQSHLRMRLLAIAFDWMLITLLMMLVVMFVFGQAWLLNPASYTDITLYLVIMSVPMAYFGTCWSLLGATPGRLLLLPWLEG